MATEIGATLKSLSQEFIKLIKMLLVPMMLLTLVSGIAKVVSMKEMGRASFAH